VQSTGILFRYRACNVCNKFLDEMIAQKRHQMNLAMTARRGTFVSHSAFEDSDEDDYDHGSVDPNSELMRLYECGHAFHYQCIRKYVSEKQQEKSDFKGQHSKIKPI